jgi:hypothetical protein
MMGESRQIFISYARSDAERVDALVEGLRQLRYDAWIDAELTGGQAWWDTVLSQIRASSAVLVGLSPAALESIAVRREYEYAYAVGRSLLPVVVNRVRLETLPSLLARLQVVDYCQPDMKSAFALAAALAALPTPRALPQPLPEPPPIPISYLSGLKERSQAATLSMDEQLALVARLKVALDRASERTAAEEVLRSLQSRDDLYQVSAREIETILPPLSLGEPAPVEPAKASLRKSSTRKWEVVQIVARSSWAKIKLELIRHDRHILESRMGLNSTKFYLDKVPFDKKSTVQFLDGGELVRACIGQTWSNADLKSFYLELDDERVYEWHKG